MYYNVLLRYNKNTRSFLCRHTQITIGKNVLPIKSLLLFHNLEHYQFNYSANLCFYTSQNVIEFSAFVVQYLELCNKCTAKHSTCTGSLVSIGLMTTIHSSLYRRHWTTGWLISVWERGGRQTLDRPRWLKYIHHPNKTAKALNRIHIHYKSQHNVWDLHSSQILYMYMLLHAIK